MKGFAPLRVEYDLHDLAIEGELPSGLAGTYYRIGPNPQFPPRAPYNPLNGDGMIHAFHLGGGRAVYRNRWVRTRQWTLDHAAGRALFGTTGLPTDRDESVLSEVTDGVANTNLAWHAGRLLALEEGHGPIEIDPADLTTRGPWSFAGALPRNMTAHPKRDPATGELLFFANFPTGRISRDIGVYVADAAGEIVRSETIQAPFPALMHDFAITADFMIFLACPVTVSVRRGMEGRPMIAWEPELGTHLGVLPRGGAAEDLRWFAGEPGMAWHVMNAFNEGGRIVVDVCLQDEAVFPRADGSPTNPAKATQRLVRWTLDWDGPAQFAAERLSDMRCEYPRFDERFTGRPYGVGFLACDGGPGSGDPFHRGLARFNHARAAMSIWSAGPTMAVSEPVFVARSADAPEGAGWILANVFDETTDASFLAVFDAETLDAGPVAKVHVAHRIPMGFHGQWIGA
jgi:carotenoid cleavage dioxygenase